jgi:plastocyanin
MSRAIATVGVVGAIALTGCGGGDSGSTKGPGSSSTTTGSTAAAVSTDRIDIADFKYDPDAVTVTAGTTVTWANSDDAAHTATADDSSFDTGDLERGDSKAITLEKPGTYSYYCRFHPFMKATVEVR